MTTRRRIVAAVLALISLPPLLALVEAVSYHARNRNNGSLVSSGERREHLLYVPQSYDAATPTPLVISLHGGGGWPAIQRDVSRWNRVADRNGFIVVYPSGLKVAGLRAWRVWEGVTGLENDVRYISDLIDSLEKTYTIDPERIYANGLSNGGAMAWVLSCTMSDRVAAVGTVAAAHALPWSWCMDDKPVPAISFHGTQDSLVPYKGGTSWVSPNRPFPAALQWAESWALRNGCAPDPVETPVSSQVTRRHYTSCANTASVVLYTIDGGGHTWPGGMPLPEWFLGSTTYQIDASTLIWEFFEEHRLGTN